MATDVLMDGPPPAVPPAPSVANVMTATNEVAAAASVRPSLLLTLALFFMFLICVLWPLIGPVFLWCAQEEPNREPNSEAAAAETKTGAGDEEGKVPAAAKDEDAGNNLDKGDRKSVV